MGAISSAVKHMLAAGMDADAIVRAIEDMEAATEARATTEDLRRERNRRYYEKRASEKRLKASEQDVSDAGRLKASEKRLNQDASRADSIISNLPEVITPSPPKGGSVPKITRPRKPEPDDFDEWYGAYPKHVGRDAAAKAYAAARKRGATRGELFAGAQRYAAERSSQNPEFTKQPATWLNAGCWKDEPTQTFNGSSHGPRSHHRPAKIDAAFAAMAEVFGAGDEPGLPAEDPGGPIIDHEPTWRGPEPHRGLRPIDGGRDGPRDRDDRDAASGRLFGGWR